MSNDTQHIDNSDIDMSGVSLARPLLPKQTLRCRTGEVKLEATDKMGRQLVVPVTLEEPGKDTKGNVVNVGFVVTGRIGLDAKGNRTQLMVQEQLGRFMVAALRLAQEDNLPPFKLSDLSVYSGKELLVEFDTRPDKQDASKLYQDVKRYYAIKG